MEGKKLNNENGELMITVAKTQKYKEHHIDALAGATLLQMALITW